MSRARIRVSALALLALAGCARTFASSVAMAGSVGGAAGGGIGALIAPDGARGQHAAVAAATTAAGAALVWTGILVMSGARFTEGPDADDAWAGAFTGVPGYLVATDILDDHATAARRATAFGDAATVVQSDLFAGLPPHQFLVVVARYKHRGRAAARARELRGAHPDVRVVDGRAARAARSRRRFVPVRAAMRWSGDPRIHIRTPDGEFDTRVDDRAGVSFWVAQDGPIAITVAPRADDPAADDPRACRIAAPYHREVATAQDAIDLTPDGCAPDGRVDGAPGFLVISGVFDRYADALRSRDRIGGESTATVLASDRFAGTTPGHFLVVIGRHDRAADAEQQAAGWRPNVPTTFVQDSGALRGPLRRLVRIRAAITARVTGPVHVTTPDTPDGALDTPRPPSG
ncbi:MAG: hypothetical protein K8W52_25370, partial [Deltaproteobacteria bacterium]|nr:hypothetical protein [Deltaproteobacteria bacterium]